MADVTIHGECDARFAKVRDGFASNFAAGKEIGASVCVTVNGKPVLDLCGRATPTKRARSRGTRTRSSTCTRPRKGSARRARRCWWSAANSISMRRSRSTGPSSRRRAKRSCRCAIASRIRPGLPAIKKPLSAEDMYDWTRRCARNSPRRSRGGRPARRTAITRSPMVGSLANWCGARAAAASARFFREEIVHPLALDAFIGSGPELDARIADLKPSPPPAPGTRDLLAEMMADKESLQGKTFGNPPALGPGVVNSRAWRAAEICSANGHTNARSLATLLCGARRVDARRSRSAACS